MPMKIKIFTVFTLLFFVSITATAHNRTDKQQINETIDAWHKAAAEANFDLYFKMMTADAIFIGTDATEYWSVAAFKTFAKPFFDLGKTWRFTSLERNVYVSKSGETAWFDELLDTQMKICRGSGVLVKVGELWKIQHYVLSMTIPNDNVKAVVAIKTPLENLVTESIKSQK